MTRVPYAGDEKTSLSASLDRHRDTILWKLEGLDDEALRRPMVSSETSLLGLVKQLAGGEYGWFCDTFGRDHEPLPFDLDEAQRPLGRDGQGRQVLEYVPGPMAIDQPRLDDGGLRRVGRLIRDLHDASAGFSPPPGSRWNVAIPPDRRDLVCHHDLAPWNLVTGADRWVFIDWDGAGPGSRLWDLAYAMKGFVPMAGGGDPSADAPRLRALADGYGLSASQREELPPLIGAHTRGMADLLEDGARTGAQPWARLYAEGHGEHWAAAADYIERNAGVWRRALR